MSASEYHYLYCSPNNFSLPHSPSPIIYGLIPGAVSHGSSSPATPPSPSSPVPRSCWTKSDRHAKAAHNKQSVLPVPVGDSSIALVPWRECRWFVSYVEGGFHSLTAEQWWPSPCRPPGRGRAWRGTQQSRCSEKVSPLSLHQSVAAFRIFLYNELW